MNGLNNAYGQRQCGPDSRESGVILILTLFVIAIFTVIVLEFSYTTRVEYHIASTIRDGLIAGAIARAGVYEKIAMLRNHRLQEIAEKEEEEEKKTGESGTALTKEEQDKKKKAEEEKKKSTSKIEEVPYPDHYGEDWAAERYQDEFGAGFLTVKVFDESGKIPINTLVKELKPVQPRPTVTPTPLPGEEATAGETTEKEKIKKTPRKWGQKDEVETEETAKPNEKTAEEKPEEEKPARYVVDKNTEKDIMRLIETLDVKGVKPEEVTAAIVDWMDSNEEGDFEDDAYGGVPPKNTPLDVLSELLLVKGVTADLYFGPGREEETDLEALLSGKPIRKRGGVGLRDCLSAFSRAKVNINTAPPEVIAALCPEENESLVKEIVGYTKKDYFKDLKHFEEKIGSQIPGSLMRSIGVGSDCFQIIAEGQVNETKKRLQAFVYMDNDANVRILFWRVER